MYQCYHGDSCRNVHRVDIIAIDKWVEAGRCRGETVSPLPGLLVRCNSLEVCDWLRTHTHARQCLAATNKRKQFVLFSAIKTRSSAIAVIADRTAYDVR